MLGESDPTLAVVARLHVLSCLVLQPDPGEGDMVGDEVVELGVVDEDPVVEAGLEEEEETVGVDVSRERVRIVEGVTQPSVHHGHVAAPQGGVHHGLLDIHGEGLLAHTPQYILPSPHLITEAADELPRRQVARVLPAIARAVGTEGDGGGRNPGLDITIIVLRHVTLSQCHRSYRRHFYSDYIMVFKDFLIFVLAWDTVFTSTVTRDQQR